ncbi:serine protease 33-like [Pseudophryne corroboree]|uniref:serine protease 33-like n=1 Tax=Pseudophryne corroboree TaxID=495146 RepID=UPI00308170C3
MMGATNLTGTSNTRVIMPVKQYYVHPTFDPVEASGDIALIELKNPVTFNSYIQPICLPTPNQEFPDGMKGWLAGWGALGEGVKLPSPFPQQEVELPLINYTACNKIFQSSLNLSSSTNTVMNTNICAGYPEGKKDGCQGDSGGPLVCQLGSCWNLVGVVSWGSGCARPNMPGVYTMVSSYVTWIQKQTNISGAATCEMTLTTHATTVQLNTFTTKNKTGAVQIFNISETSYEGATGAGVRLSVSVSLLVTAVVFSRIL